MTEKRLGRPPIPEDRRLVTVTIRLTRDQAATLRAIGPEPVRKVLDVVGEYMKEKQ